MKIMVAVKRVVDYSVHIHIKADGSGVETNHVKMAMNPFDEIALEAAIRFKEKQLAHEVIAVSIGSQGAQETLRSALAMGADRALLVETDHLLQPLNSAKILEKIVKQEAPDLVMLGKQAIDTDDNQTGQMLAGLLNWPQGTFASDLVLDDKTIRVTREIDGGLETITLQLPAVITTDLRLNQPRYLSLPNIVQAKRKSITIIPLNEWALQFKSSVTSRQVSPPEKRKAGIKVASVAELIDRLKNEARVIS
jgi:electron transfer flavoprotein beta subunit